MQEIMGLEEFGAGDDQKFMVVVTVPMLRVAIDGPLSEGVLNQRFEVSKGWRRKVWKYRVRASLRSERWRGRVDRRWRMRA